MFFFWSKFSTTGAESNSPICTCFWILIATIFCEKEKRLDATFCLLRWLLWFFCWNQYIDKSKKMSRIFSHIFFWLDKYQQLILYFLPKRNMHYHKEKNVFYAKNNLDICAILFYFHFFASDFIIWDKKKMPRIIFVMMEKNTRFIGIFTRKLREWWKKICTPSPGYFLFDFFGLIVVCTTLHKYKTYILIYW